MAIISFILIILMNDSAVLLYGEIKLLGFRGLKSSIFSILPGILGFGSSVENRPGKLCIKVIITIALLKRRTIVI